MRVGNVTGDNGAGVDLLLVSWQTKVSLKRGHLR